MRSERARNRSAAGRGLLRYILGGYTDVPAEKLRFESGPGGKPMLSAGLNSDRLHFNVSHSGGILLVAVGRSPVLGVDVERVRPISRAGALARRVFSDGERDRLQGVPAESRTEAFFNCWTRKEACVKATGEGVWSAFARFEVTVEPGHPARILAVDGDEAKADDWSLHHLEPAPGYVGALAAEGSGWRLGTFTLGPPEMTR
jgi:4'-phosphopantetheinyl transferase